MLTEIQDYLAGVASQCTGIPQSEVLLTYNELYTNAVIPTTAVLLDSLDMHITGNYVSPKDYPPGELTRIWEKSKATCTLNVVFLAESLGTLDTWIHSFFESIEVGVSFEDTYVQFEASTVQFQEGDSTLDGFQAKIQVSAKYGIYKSKQTQPMPDITITYDPAYKDAVS